MRAVKHVEEGVDELRTRVHEQITRYTDAHGAPEIPKVSVHVRVGLPAEQIVQVAAELQAGLIVVGTHGRRGMSRAMMGSVAESVVRTAGCPVLVMRALQHPVYEGGVGDEVEAPCDECEARRAETSGEHAFCDRHASRHSRPHAYAYESRSVGSVRPWGFS